VKRLSFRTRLFVILLLFAVIPTVLLMLGGAAMVSQTLPLISGSGAWEEVATSGARAFDSLRAVPLSRGQRAALEEHEAALGVSLEHALRVRHLAPRALSVMVVFALVGAIVLGLFAWRVAAHLSRQLSRPLDEVVGWTELIAAGTPLPDLPPRRGAPEFLVLRRRMREMARALAAAREREREAQRLEAYRETAQRVAHELKNPLTPIRFAVARLSREAPPAMREVVEVLEVESRRLEEMARSFAQFGRLPEGPMSEVDLAELARYTTRATVPEHVSVSLSVDEHVPMIRGHHDALARALSNVLLNAVDACRDGGRIDVRVATVHGDGNGQAAVELAVRDSGCGIPPHQLARIWEPYATFKAGGTGLGLAIARQTVLAHHGTTEAKSVVGEGTEIRFVLPVDGSVA
jgi:signal transduction histidine kinase